MSTVYLGLGSNLSQRQQLLYQAVERLYAHHNIEIQKLSSIYETEPVGSSLQSRYLNAACKLKTELSPKELLELTKKIEFDLGRRKKGNWESRFIDLDLLVYDEVITESEDLNLPHPLLAQRWFVLVPMSEIAPELTPPGYSHTIKELLAQLGEPQGVYKLNQNEPWGKYSHLIPG